MVCILSDYIYTGKSFIDTSEEALAGKSSEGIHRESTAQNISNMLIATREISHSLSLSTVGMATKDEVVIRHSLEHTMETEEETKLCLFS